jgi:hypothetical protein
MRYSPERDSRGHRSFHDRRPTSQERGNHIFSSLLPPFLFVCVRACVCSFPNLLDCLLILNLPLSILYILSPLYNFMDFFNYLQNLPFHVHPAGRGMWCVSNDLIINIYWMHMCVYCWLYIGFYISCQLILCYLTCFFDYFLLFLITIWYAKANLWKLSLSSLINIASFKMM